MLLKKKSEDLPLVLSHSKLRAKMLNNNISIDSDTISANSPLKLFHNLLTTWFNKNHNKNAPFTNFIRDIETNQQDFPLWVKNTMQKDKLLSCLIDRGVIRAKTAMFFIFACHTVSISAILYIWHNASLELCFIDGKSKDQTTVLIIEPEFYLLNDSIEMTNDNIDHPSKNRYFKLNTELNQNIMLNDGKKSEAIVKIIRKCIKSKNSTLTHHNDSNYDYKIINKARENEKMNCITISTETKNLNGFKTYKHITKEITEKYFQNRPEILLNDHEIISPLTTNTLIHTHPRTINDDECYKDKSYQHDINKPLIININYLLTSNNKEDQLDDFQKALAYITIYQKNLHKRLRSMANGKIYDLISEDVSEEHFEGVLKFYKEKSKFGFIYNIDGSEVFLHKDNLVKSRIDSQMLEICARFFDIQFRFQTLAYKGNRNSKLKAVNIQIINFVPKVIED